MKKIILATRNPGKVREIKSILSNLPIELQSLLDYPDLPEVVEDGKTLEENALKKSKEIFHATGLPTLSDDSGLEVFELGLRPGVLSARFAGEAATYDDNNRKLLAELEGFEPSRHKARFRCVAVFRTREIERMTEGTCHGRIIEAPRGSGGFGYDPIFLPDGYNHTFAELPLEIKNQISHRAKALRRMREILTEYLI